MSKQVSTCSSETTRVVAFYSRDSRHFCYVLSEIESGACAIIDPSANYLACGGRLIFKDADAIVSYVEEQSLAVQWILETDVHTNHFSASGYIRDKTGGQLAISKGVAEIPQRTNILHPDVTLAPKGFDALLSDNQILTLGKQLIQAMAIPGRSPASMAFLVEGCLFAGNALFMPDKGPACGCSPLADRNIMQQSLLRILKRPDKLRVFIGRDSDKPSRSLEYETTIGQLRKSQLNLDVPSDSCLNRNQYASELCPLFWPALQFNLQLQDTALTQFNLKFPLRVGE